MKDFLFLKQHFLEIEVSPLGFYFSYTQAIFRGFFPPIFAMMRSSTSEKAKSIQYDPDAYDIFDRLIFLTLNEALVLAGIYFYVFY